MSSFEHNRFKIVNKAQHPYNHDSSEIGYSNEALSEDIINVSGAMDYIMGVLYPNLKPAVANVAALPALGNALNDYRLVQDDGDGKSAGYRWAKYEEEVSPSWHKMYDIDWGLGDVLSATEAATQANYVYKWGRNDKDAAGVDVAGLYAGSRIYGGSTASSNLTLQANSADPDGVAANQTGYVQVDSQFRPTYHNAYDAGTATERWRTIYAQTSMVSGTLTLAAGSITDSSGAISFDNENVTTTGFLQAGNIKISVNTFTSENVDGNLIFNPNGTGTVELQANTNITGSLTATGDIDAVGYGEFGNLRLAVNTLSSQNVDGNIVLDPNGTGLVDIQASMTGTGDLDFAGYGEFGNLRLAANTLSSQNANGDITLDPDGSGVINLSAATYVTGNFTVSSGNIGVGNLLFSNNSISATNVNGDISLDPNGAGSVVVSKVLLPSTNNTLDLGTSGLRFNELFLGGSISDGTNAITMATLMSLRDINVGVSAGMSLFYDGSKWVASVPDTEITHNTLTGLTSGDAGHTQFALLAGRAGGQTLNGGTAASENLTLDSTAHATKGSIFASSNIKPTTDASYSGGWSGTDLGDSTHNFRHLYSKGEHFNLRLENVGALPGASAQNVGRIVFNTATNSVSVDQGGAWVSFVSASAFLNGLNAFGGTASLGTSDAFGLDIKTNNITALSISTTQIATFSSRVIATSISSDTGASFAIVDLPMLSHRTGTQVAGFGITGRVTHDIGLYCRSSSDTFNIGFDGGSGFVDALSIVPSTFAATFAGNAQIGAVGSVKELSIGATNTFFRIRERDATNDFGLSTNMSDSGVQDDASKSSWKIKLGSNGDFFGVARSPAGANAFVYAYTIESNLRMYLAGGGGTGSGSIVNAQLEVFDTTSQATGVGGGITFTAYQTGTSSKSSAGTIKGYKENATAGNASYALQFYTKADAANETLAVTLGSDHSMKVYGEIFNNGKSAADFGTVGGNLVALRGNSTEGYLQCGANITTGSTTLAYFYDGAGLVGSISINADTNTTLYNTTSDYRLKTNIEGAKDALSKLSEIKIRRFNWKSCVEFDKSWGVIAHELQDVFPEAISGEKDAVDNEGRISPQFVDYSKLVPLLVASIQELKTEIEVLKNGHN